MEEDSNLVFGVPPLASSAREPAGPASSGVFILVFDKQKNRQAASKGNLMDN